MYFLLKKNSLGVLNISSEGICRFVQEFLLQKDLKSVSCRSFYIPDSRKGNGLLVLNKKDDEAEKIISELMDVAGIKTTFIYAYDGAADVNFAEKTSLSMRSPWFWCSLVAVVALFVFVGLAGLFWLSFWGSVGWFASKFIMFLRISSWRSSIGKN
jgi:hypothetical protein